MKNKKGLSLVELLTSIVISSILILLIGILTSTANSSFNKYNREQAIYNDISYGFKLMQNKVRASTVFSKALKPGTPALVDWRSDQLVVGAITFGVYRNLRNGKYYRDFVAATGTQELILSVPDDGDSDNNLLMTINGCDCTRNGPTIYDCTTPPATTACSGTPKSATLVLTGKKDNIPFDMETTIAKRN